ncbi:MAG: HRDC domain-containing protein [Pirellulales bacterium]|nr:HRDC domain-containing protein [Pirellulales bacterium]
MSHLFIKTDRELASLCDTLVSAERIGFDTEFVSEYSYRSELCLVQVAASKQPAGEELDVLAVIDPQQLEIEPFWQLLANGDHETIVHAGREELIFCLRSVQEPPANMIDMQLAAGFIGTNYPAGYGNLVAEILGRSSGKGETRTDWRRRPLSPHQLEYALDDVRHLLALHERLSDSLERLGRRTWLDEEMTHWQTGIQESLAQPAWRRISGAASLRRRELGVLSELWQWRESEAERTDQPARRVLRDDLLIELARRKTDDVKRIQAVRGFERQNYRRLIPAISRHIKAALQVLDAQLPQPLPRREKDNSQRSVVVQLLGAALSAICRDAEIAPNLVGTASDVRDLVAEHFGERNDSQRPPALATGWRAEIVGRKLNDVLSGKLTLRIQDANADQPLAFE